MDDEEFVSVQPSGFLGIAMHFGIALSLAVEKTIKATVESPDCKHMTDEEIIAEMIEGLNVFQKLAPQSNWAMVLKLYRERMNV